MEPPKENPVSPEALRAAAAKAVTPDPVLAKIIERHNAGEKLSPQEYGMFGNWRRTLKRVFTGKPGADGAVVAGPGAPVAQAAPAGDLAAPADPRLIQRTTDSLLEICGGIAGRKLASKAKRAGSDDKTVDRFDALAHCPKGARQMMVETSPDVAAFFGVTPQAFPLGAFLSGMALWAGSIWLAVDELSELERKRDSARAAELKRTQQPPPIANREPPNGLPGQWTAPLVTQPGVTRPADITIPKGPVIL